MGLVTRQSPAEPLAVLDGYLLTWKPALAVMRLVQLVRLLEAPRPEGQMRRDQFQMRGTAIRTDRVRAWAEEAGVAWVGRQARTRCSCGRLTERLIECGGRWVCQGCVPETYDTLEVAMGDYGCALRLGMTGFAMRYYRGRLALRVARRARTMRSFDDLVAATRVGALLELPIPRARRGRGRMPRRRYGAGPVRYRLAPLLMPAAIDALLHRDAFLERFGRQRDRRAA